ncbi:hypothetical protein ACJJTC_000140 [Scirpophaga incertulas]
MSELEAQIQGAGEAKDTVSKVADEFRTFRELIFNVLGILRKQINECSNIVDNLEMRSRRKALIFLGVKECETEDCKALVLNTLLNTMGLKDIASNSIKGDLFSHGRVYTSVSGHVGHLIKPSSDDGDRHKITSVAELHSLVARYPKKSGGEMSASSALSAKR